MISLIAAASLSMLALPAAPERPMDPWVFRSVLDGQARMVTVALHDDLWAAYDATDGRLYKAWKGGVEFDGAVYTTRHGPQPTSQGEAYLEFGDGEAYWAVAESIVTGRPERADFRYLGYRFDEGSVTLRYELTSNQGTVLVEETPEAIALPNGRVRLERSFNAVSDDGLLAVLVEAESEPFFIDGDRTWSRDFDVPEFLDDADVSITPSVNLQAEPRESGLSLRVYEVGEPLSRVPLLVAGQTPNYSVRIPNVDLTDEDFGGIEDRFLVHISGFLNVVEAGVYRFRLASDDGSRFSLRDEVIADNDGLHSIDTTAEGEFNLSPGEHPIFIEHFDNNVNAAVRLDWMKPGETEWEVIPESAFTTPADEVRVTSPGLKRVILPGLVGRPGDRRPLLDVHPSFDLTTIRPDGFEPRVGGIDFLSDGSMLICNWEPDGGVYRIEGAQGDGPFTTTRIAAGLAEPLGLKVVDDRIFVLQKQELTELIDVDDDGITDYYRSVAAGWGVTPNFHEFAFGLEHRDGAFYAALAIAIDPGGASTQPQEPDRGHALRIFEDGSYEFVAHGLRTPNGVGFGAFGDLYITDNQGDWLPSSKLVRVQDGAFYGSRAVDPVGDADTPETPPVVWLPQGEIGNSPTQPAPLDFGPWAGQMVHGDVTHGGLKRVFVEEVDGVTQGTVFRMTQGLEGGTNRVVREGRSFYIGGIGSSGNWGQEGKERFGLQRLDFNGSVAFEPLAVRTKANGLEIEFTMPLGESEGRTTEEYEVQQWRYEPTAAYGGPKLDVETLDVISVSISDDRTRAFLEIEGLKENHVVYTRLDPSMTSAGYDPLWTTESWTTINVLPDELGTVDPATAPIPNRLSAEEVAEGFVSLFDGANPAEHWRGFRRDDLPAGWQAIDDELRLVQGVGGGDIVTREIYGDFELRLEWKISRGGNSGIMYRVSEEFGNTFSSGAEMQILDDRAFPSAPPQHKAGANYDMQAPAFEVSRPAGEWNEVRLVVRGSQVEQWLNGTLIVEFDMDGDVWREQLANSKFWDWEGYAEFDEGHIALQDHGQNVAFRNLRIKRL